MSLAEETREAIRDRPALFDALRAGVLNYSAAARRLDLGEEEPVATALRRFEEQLDGPDARERSVRVRMRRIDPSGDRPIEIAGSRVDPDGNARTAVVATGEVDPRALEAVLGRLRTHGIETHAAGTAGDSLAVVVDRRDGADAVRTVERTLQSG